MIDLELNGRDWVSNFFHQKFRRFLRNINLATSNVSLAQVGPIWAARPPPPPPPINWQWRSEIQLRLAPAKATARIQTHAIVPNSLRC